MENKAISSATTDRKTIERNRRNQMKALYSKLYSLVPHHSTKEPMSLPDQLEEAANYIKKLQTNIERMKQRKDCLMGVEESSGRTCRMELRTQKIQIQEMGSALEVVFTTGLDGQVLFNDITRLLQEEGAEIVNASFSVVGDTVFHTIHSTVGDSASTNETARIFEMLRRFTEDSTS